MKSFYILLLSLLVFVPCRSSDYRLHSRHVTTTDGLLGNAVNEIVQDHEGYIWMATNNGLSRFDGYSTLNYTSLSPDPSRHIEARIGRIYHDERRELLWMNTSVYQNACYDLRQARFVDYTGQGDFERQQNKLVLTSRGMALYGMATGVTLCGMTGDRHWAKNYTRKSGGLPSDDVLTIIEDSAHNIWLPTTRGIAVIAADDERLDAEILSPADTTLHVISAATTGRHTCFLADNGRVLVYDTSRRKVLDVTTPATMPFPRKVNTGFVWQGQWMLFTPEGTYTVDLKKGKIDQPAQWQVLNGLSQGTCRGYHLIGTRKGELLLFSDKGDFSRFHLIPNAHYVTNKGWLFHVTADLRGRLFIATYGNGLFVYDPTDGSMDHYQAGDASPVIDSNYLLCAITDHQGDVWIGSETAGAYCLSVQDKESVSYLQPCPDARGGWDNTITTLACDTLGHIIVCTRDGMIYETARGVMTQTDSKAANVTAYMRDRSGHTWMGTWGDGLYLDGQHYHQGDSAHYVPTNFINNFVEDRNGIIWVATWNGGLLRYEQGVFRQFLNDHINSSRVNHLALSENGTLWAATNNGVCCLSEEGAMTVYNTANKQFPNDEVVSLLCDGRNMLWAGTAGSGVVRCTLGDDGTISHVETLTTANGLSNNNVKAIVKDGEGYVWVGTEDGLSCINPRTLSINTYRFAETIQGNVVSNNCGLATPSGQLLFGTADGLLTFVPGKITGNTTAKLVITNLHINGSPCQTTPPSTLTHDQNSLSFYFSSFQYTGWQNPVFQYYLEGWEKGWQNLTTRNHADYSELRPGRYTFHVRALNAMGQWQPETTLTLTILQPWYNRWWAWVVYTLIILLIGYYVYCNGRERFRLHQQVKMERQLSEFRTTLFTNITHEFRTPLAIIKGAVDKLAQNGSNQAAQQTALRATDRMLHMVNQFMEYRKITTGNLRLGVEQADIVTFLRNLIQDLRIMAQQKEQHLTFTPFDKHFEMLFDKQKVEAICYNLLSNAIKYTPERGSISVRMKTEGTTLVIVCEDSGPGITQEQERELFKPFMHGYVSQGGMGIGLYTARQLALAHHGQLSYQRASESGGARFTLTLPVSDVYAQDEHAETGALASQPATDADLGAALIQEMQTEACNDLTIAVIEDNPDMMQQISSELGTYFHIAAYATGQAGYEGILASPPSLLVCDVMLPDMDGYQIVSRLKDNGKTASLPIIMLTALDDENHQIKAYKAGADDYMVKPCNFRLLVARIMQLIKWREKRGEWREESAASVPLIESRRDKVFLEKLAMLTAQHLSDDSFSVDRLAEMMSMGRTKFYGKVKELTAMSPNKYLQEARMQRAAQLLLEGELTVSEVSYKVGIQDPSYFNKVFKARYGVVPSKYGR